MLKRGFASDNNAGVHPEIMKAIQKVNEGHTIAYGEDPFTASAVQKIKNILGDEVEPFFVFIGTAANVLGLDAVTKPYHSIICAETSHIHEDECGAPERWTGCKLLPVDTPDGKLTPASVDRHMYGIDFEHHSQPRVISITQSTEMGTVYTPDEIKAITDYAHDRNMLVHMDGARICNAAAGLGTGIREITAAAGIDVLSFGGTKNGMMYGEAVVFMNDEFSRDFKYLRKQGMQLASKMRYIAAQFERYLDEDIWLKNARHANRMAKLLEAEMLKINEIRITQPVQSNAVFAILPKKVIPLLQDEFFFYVWNETTGEVRWMCSYDTTEDDILKFSELVREVMK
jgi:threonine aldolase